jgi:hypothetical protein
LPRYSDRRSCFDAYVKKVREGALQDKLQLDTKLKVAAAKQKEARAKYQQLLQDKFQVRSLRNAWSG